METVVSGTRPTGTLHLGNYVGAVRNYVRMQNEGDNNCFFFIADYHSLTTHPHPDHLNDLVKQTVATYLGCGLDPDKVHIYLQSDVPQTAELYLFFNMLAYKGELEKVTTFKEKIKKHKENINAGLLTYPVLMAADILIHRATKVPVGKDQEQHLEMTRTFARRFNHIYETDFFPEPVAYNFGNELIRIPSLDGTGKMSKSDNPNSAIFMTETDEMIRKKIMRAKTDSGPIEKNQNPSEEIDNLFALMKIVSEADTLTHFQEAYSNCTIRYGELKKQLASDMVDYVGPFREQIAEWRADEQGLRKVLMRGGEAARESAEQTVSRSRGLIGINYYKQ